MDSEAGVRERPARALEPPVGRALEQVHARAADERPHPAVGRAIVDLGRRADLLHAALAQDRDLVGHRHRLDLVVGHVQERALHRAVDARQLRPHLDAQLEVEVGQRLVHQERARLAHQRAAERDALLLAARHLRRPAIEQALDVQQLGDALHALGDLRLGQLARAQRRGDVLRRRPLRVQGVALEHHRQVALGRRGAGGIQAVQVHRADVGLLEPGDHAQRRRLAGAGRAEQDEERAVGNVELQPVERLHGAERLRDPGRDDRAGHRLTAFPLSGS